MHEPTWWLSEQTTRDDTYASQREHSLDWLARSTLPRAREARRFLNQDLQMIPTDAQMPLFRALWNRWDSAFFELIVIRTLQELGAEVQIEVANAEGKRPDILARFSDTAITVEAKAPNYHADAAEELKAKIPMLDFIEANMPDGWYVGVSELPRLGANDSLREFKRVVTEMLS